MYKRKMQNAIEIQNTNKVVLNPLHPVCTSYVIQPHKATMAASMFYNIKLNLHGHCAENKKMLCIAFNILDTSYKTELKIMVKMTWK